MLEKDTRGIIIVRTPIEMTVAIWTVCTVYGAIPGNLFRVVLGCHA